MTLYHCIGTVGGESITSIVGLASLLAMNIIVVSSSMLYSALHNYTTCPIQLMHHVFSPRHYVVGY